MEATAEERGSGILLVGRSDKELQDENRTMMVSRLQECCAVPDEWKDPVELIVDWMTTFQVVIKDLKDIEGWVWNENGQVLLLLTELCAGGCRMGSAREVAEILREVGGELSPSRIVQTEEEEASQSISWLDNNSLSSSGDDDDQTSEESVDANIRDRKPDGER
ncbi:hypothetical protein R1sor_005984 [Riccia sorocarpa]|uniref:Uncharacterized protein n=1 Tax=Riccia sorocarpa TaxID=122646 RepID=A0ABD3HLN3_9MARC